LSEDNLPTTPQQLLAALNALVQENQVLEPPPDVEFGAVPEEPQADVPLSNTMYAQLPNTVWNLLAADEFDTPERRERALCAFAFSRTKDRLRPQDKIIWRLTPQIEHSQDFFTGKEATTLRFRLYCPLRTTSC
jgi:hypothetical protein